MAGDVPSGEYLLLGLRYQAAALPTWLHSNPSRTMDTELRCAGGHLTLPAVGVRPLSTHPVGWLATFRRYLARQARRPSLPLVVRGMAPAASSCTSAAARLWFREIAARIAWATGACSARPAPTARSAMITRRSPVSSG